MARVPIREHDPNTALEVKQLDHLEVLSTLWDELGFSELIDASVPVDEQVQLTPGIGVKGLVLNLISGRSPLYRVEEFFGRSAISAILGEDTVPAHFNDTSLARLLDRIFKSKPANLFSALSMRAVVHEDLPTDRVHADTTSKLLFGAYKTEDPEAVSITYGHSKDHRPDLKQVMFGLATNTHGVPVVGQMLDGNQSDKPWHGGLLETIRDQIHRPEGVPLEYVGDSALITRENITTAKKKGIVLTGRLPRTVTRANDAVEWAYAQPDCWQDIGAVSERPKAARYQAQWFCTRVLDEDVTLAVYRSDQPNQRAEQSVQRQLKRDQQAFDAKKKEIEKKTFGCEEDAQMELKALERLTFGTLLESAVRVECRVEEQSFPKRGRPKKDEIRPTRQTYHVIMERSDNKDVIKAVLRKKSCFVLLHTGTSIQSPKELLSHYKDQMLTEKRFPFLKDGAMADVFFVKTPHRVETLGWIMLIGLLLWSLWERRVRLNHRASGEGPLIDTPGNKVANPTAFVCREIMRGILLVRACESPDAPWQHAKPLNLQQARVIRFSRRYVPASVQNTG